MNENEIVINEELMEEIDTLLLEELGVGYNYPRVYFHRTINKAIALVLSAVHNGKQRLPGELWRCHHEAVSGMNVLLVDGYKGAYDSIALRPEKGGERDG